MSWTIHLNGLDPDSINDGIKSLRDYKKWVRRMTDELRRRVGDYIRENAQTAFNSAVADNVFAVKDGSPVDYTVMANVDVDVFYDDDNFTVVYAFGEHAVFIEFGAGVYYNGAPGSSPHPRGDDLGFTIGSYGKGNGVKKVWGFYGSDGLHLTHGTPAQMPMYKAEMAAVNDIVNIAREVFRA